MGDRVRDVLHALDDQREELAAHVLDLANVYAPVGQEAVVAQEVDRWYREHGIESEVVEMIEGRANVVARLPGTQHGESLLFNAHLDTEVSGSDYDNLMQAPDPNKVGAWREGDHIFGHTALNDRHAHSLFMFAARAIKRAGLALAGDLILTSVAGETGQAPVDEYTGFRYVGEGFGSSFLVDHGIRADHAIVSETTDFALCWHQCGANYYKITFRGKNMYTPRYKRGSTLAENPNAIVKAAAAIGAIEDWAVDYTKTHTRATPCGEARPQALTGAVRGGIPYRANRSSPYCALYVDVRTLPDQDPDEVTASLTRAVTDLDIEAEIKLLRLTRGALGTGVEPLADAIRWAHRTVRGSDPPPEAESAVVSMWRDTNVFNRAGIPTINFGPGRGKADVQGRGYLDLDALVDAAKMYALISLRIAGGLSQEDLE